MAGPVRRRSNGRRVYDESDVERLGNCTRFRASGMPWATIREFAELVRRGPGDEAERLDLLRAHQQRVVERIAELTECLDVIGTKVAVYAEHVERGGAEATGRGSGALVGHSAGGGTGGGRTRPR